MSEKQHTLYVRLEHQNVNCKGSCVADLLLKQQNAFLSLVL